MNIKFLKVGNAMDAKDLFAIRFVNSSLTTQNDTLLETTSRFVGIQAQHQRMAELNLLLRTRNATLTDLNQLYSKQAIIRTWSQRWTLHLMTPTDYNLVINARQKEKIPNNYYQGHKEQVLEATEDLTKLFLNTNQMSKNDFEDILIKELNIDVKNTNLAYVILQLLTSKGIIYMDANSAHTNYTLLSPQNFEQVEVSQAIKKLIPHYLAGFGPASLQDFVKWSGIKISTVRPVWNQLASDFYEVQFEDTKLFSLSAITPSTIKLAHKELHDKLLLAARFDASMTGYADKDWLIKPEYQSIMWSKNGILLAPIIQNEEVVGNWMYKLTKGKIEFTINTWSSLDKKQLETKLIKIANFMESKVGNFNYLKL